jgi:hypothetical protein
MSDGSTCLRCIEPALLSILIGASIEGIVVVVVL